MKELSLHILDIVQNSVTAGAKYIGISLNENADGILTVTVADDGKGMNPEVLERVKNPFYTTRTTRKVGMGIPLLTLAAKQTGGSVGIVSKTESGTHVPGIDAHGTIVTAIFNTKNIDCPPLGDIVTTITMLIHGNPKIDFKFAHSAPGLAVLLETKTLREHLGEVPLCEPEVIGWITGSLNEQYQINI